MRGTRCDGDAIVFLGLELAWCRESVMFGVADECCGGCVMGLAAAIQCLKRKKLYEVQVEQLGNFQLRIHDQVRDPPLLISFHAVKLGLPDKDEVDLWNLSISCSCVLLIFHFFDLIVSVARFCYADDYVRGC